MKRFIPFDKRQWNTVCPNREAGEVCPLTGKQKCPDWRYGELKNTKIRGRLIVECSRMIAGVINTPLNPRELENLYRDLLDDTNNLGKGDEFEYDDLFEAS